ncbi:MAG: hypothetical protein LBT80_01040 [Lactobacillaceae bacterium]|jgi:hypothetical protein|nr:hypothetical protein [Lactobacillaceae bacterium]
MDERHYQQPRPVPTKSTPTKFNLKQYLKSIPWFSAFFSVLAQLGIWWIYPAIYSKQLSSGQWQNNPLLITYSAFLALTIFLVFHRRFKGLVNYLFLLIPFILLYFLYKEMTFQQVFLLTLLPIALVLIHLSWLNLQNVLGLILFSGLATMSLPVVIFYQQNTYLTQPFLISLIPLLLSYLFFMSVIFVPNGKYKRLTSLAFGVMLLLNVLTLPWNLWTIIAVIVLLFTWMVLVNLDLKNRFRMPFFSVLQAVVVLLIFLQQT